MRRVVLLLFLFQRASAVRHSLKYFYTASSGVSNFPEFVAVGMVDDVQIDHYDSNTRRAEPKQDWMNKITTDVPQYWERITQIYVSAQQVFKVNIETAKQRFNQSGGVHIVQNMYGCEWDDETNEVNGFTQWGYDGEDFIVFDLRTETWIAPVPQAFITKLKWDNDKALIAQQKNYLTQKCPEWLKKYLNYGRSSLLRTDLPSVFLLQQTPSSPVRCFASGFYPERASLFWRKDGDDLHEDMEHGEILPNTDGTFQMSVDLKVSLDKPEDWEKYECVFQLSGVKDDIVTKLDKTAIKTNHETPTNMTAITAAVVVVVFVLIAVVIAAGYKFRKKKEGSMSSTSSTGTEHNSTPLVNNFGSLSSIPSTGSGDSSTPLMNNSGSSSNIPPTGSEHNSIPLMNKRGSNKK